jgi:HSP20 family molecular chaperone IbpA
MGNANLSTVKGVPMPPTAWALASMWSEIWDAPRFRGHQRIQKPALSREALAPLLKISASCVAAILPHLQSIAGKAVVPPHGASRELLVAAVEGDPFGAELSDPSGDPVRFVRALVKSAFKTGDGDYMEGLSEDSLNDLLAAHCTSQLDQAAQLQKDPSAALKASLEAACQAVYQVISEAPQAGDLASVADRLMLIQRLDRVAQDAEDILAASKQRAEAQSAVDTSTEEPLDLETENSSQLEAEAEAEDADAVEAEPQAQALAAATTEIEPAAEEAPEAEAESPAQRTVEPRGADLQKMSEAPKQPTDGEAEPLQRTQTMLSPAAAITTEANEDQPPLKRTKSQVAKSLKVQKVKKHHDELCTEIHNLCRTTSALASQAQNSPEEELESLRAELAAVEQARKRALHFGEDLVEDMLMLDNLQGLSPEDRTTRKATIAGIEGLLQDVDVAKVRLANLHSSLETKLKHLQTKMESEAKTQAEANSFSAETSNRTKIAKEERNRRAKEGKDAARTALEPPPPGKDVWRQVRLPLRFHSKEEQDHYIILATVPGLDTADLKLELGDSGDTLLVEGLRLPSEREALAMRNRIAMKIKHVAQKAPEHFERIAAALPQVAADAYIELGQGEFGRFAETFRIPDDVDIDRIDASYQDGVLRVVLPKKIPVRRMPMVPPEYGSGRFVGGRGPYSARAYPGLGGADVAPWGGSLFGGHDDFFRW